MARLTGNPAKPLLVGPITATERKDQPAMLVLPFALQGEWRDTEEGDAMLTNICGNLTVTIEDRLIESSSYIPASNSRMDSPVSLDASKENALTLRITCKNIDEARMLAELAKSETDVKTYAELINPVIERT